jgi:hypothetical protein
MKLSRLTWLVAAIGLLSAAALLDGCSKSLKSLLVPNQPPTVRLTSAPFDTTGLYFYAYKLNWIGNDPDGQVVYFLYAIDPPLNGSPINWTKTTKNEQIVFFKATKPISGFRSDDFHVFAIRAVDNGGDSSAIVTRAFFSYTVAPTVQIDQPGPTHLSPSFVTPAVHIHWIGTDPDGQFTQKPVKYKFKLLSAGSEFPIDSAIASPEALRRFYAPTFAGWDSSGAETTEVQYTNLTPNSQYMFVIVAFDEAGAYSPIFSLDSNMLLMKVLLATAGGPHITLFNTFFTFTYPGAYHNVQDPAGWINVEVPAGQPITFNWTATTDIGASISSYRWRLGGDVTDETPRTNENTDVTHWSALSLDNTSATVGPFFNDSLLFFYLQAFDNNGLRSYGIVHFHVVKPTFAKSLGVVNDTRFALDQVLPGNTAYTPPSGAWPSAAELDTFLFARGGYPYRQYPPGTISRPGVYQGYDFDTLSTRTGKVDLTVPLSELGRFRNLIWISDEVASTRAGSGFTQATATSGLRYMNDRNRVNTLATYIAAGGRVWMMGSGIAHECQAAFDKNDAGTYSFGTELIPGRFLYDVIHWRNDVHDVIGSVFTFPESIGRMRYGGWKGSPDYTQMPPVFRVKSLALGDSIPAYRVGGFYQTQFSASYLMLENRIIENLNPDPNGAAQDSSVMDTLYDIQYPPTGSGPAFPIATYYHGLENSSIVFTGFDPWEFSKVDFVALNDFVLQDIWHLTKTGTPSPSRPASIAASGALRAPTSSAGVRTLPGGARSLVTGGGIRVAPPRRAPSRPGRKPQE